MESEIIQQPQLGHLLELMTELGRAGDNLVLVGGQAARLLKITSRATKDFDFVLNVLALREITQHLSDVLNKLGYQVVAESQRFQFYKQISVNPDQQIRLEFLASDKEKRARDFRVDVPQGIHARACVGADIVLRESDPMLIRGDLPDGKYAEIPIRVIRPHALLMLKLVVMDDRHKNPRGPAEAQHDRNRAKTHTDDAIIIVRNNIQNPNFKELFWAQFDKEKTLQQRCLKIITGYFKDLNAPGCQLYREFLSEQTGDVDEAEVNRALREMNLLI